MNSLRATPQQSRSPNPTHVHGKEIGTMSNWRFCISFLTMHVVSNITRLHLHIAFFTTDTSTLALLQLLLLLLLMMMMMMMMAMVE